MPNIFSVFLYVLFYGGIGVTLFLLCFAVFGTVKLIKKSSNYKASKKTFMALTVLAGVVSVVAISVSSYFVIRFYSLPIACVEDANRDAVNLNGSTYVLSDTDYPFNTTLRPVARKNLPDVVFTPEWAIDLLFSASYYYTDGINTDLIYYTGMMEWLVYEKSP